MPLNKSIPFPLFLVMLLAVRGSVVSAGEMPVEDAWKALPSYQYGQDIAPLLAIDRAVIASMSSAETRAACAARLAALLESDQTTAAARQHICNQLRQAGTAAEVPLMAKLLLREESSEMARHVLQAIPGDESLAALRGATDTLQGKFLIGVINSLAARKDLASVPKLQALANNEDKDVAAAAVWALGAIGPVDGAGLDVVLKTATGPLPLRLAVPLLRFAESQASQGKTEQAALIYAKLSQKGQAAGVRRAALLAQLPKEGEPLQKAILAWLGGDDLDQRKVAASRLAALSDAQLGKAMASLPGLPVDSQRALIEVLAARRGEQVLPIILKMAKSDQADLRIVGVRCLGEIGDASVIPVLVDSLAVKGDVARAAQQALISLPRKEVSEAMLAALNARPEIRVPVIDVLKALRCYEAIDPLIVIASQNDAEVYGPALDGLRGIADPDETDIPRLVKLLLNTKAGRQREEVEKTILIVCEKAPANDDRAKIVLAALANIDAADAPKYLPLLGRLGGAQAMAMIEPALTSTNAEVRDAAVRAICNWPNGDVADRLLKFAAGENKEYRRMALRAYVRVISLKADRPEQQTLDMLQNAMKLAVAAEDRQLILERASTVRTLEAVEWIASFLDDPAVNQAACRAIVELARHRFLRQPNMERFGPLLDKVIAVSNEPPIVERAKRYKLGL
jgi:HEAT repeat protein